MRFGDRVGLVVVGLLLLVLQACSEQTGSDDGTTRAGFSVWDEPQPVPAVAFVDDSGRQRSLSDFKGRVVLVNLWATWCAPCREEMPTLDRLQQRLGSDDFGVVALSVDQAGSEAVRDFYQEVGLKHLQLYIDSSAQAAVTLDAIGLPTTLLLDRRGREVGRKLGIADWDHPEVADFVQELVAKPDAASANEDYPP